MRPVTKKDVLKALMDMPNNKALGFYGFPIEFFKELWTFVGDDVGSATYIAISQY